MKNSVITVYNKDYEAVTITEAKTRLKLVDRTDFDTEVRRLIRVATQWLERRYGIAILTQTREQRQDNFEYRSNSYYFRSSADPYSGIQILYPPIQSVTSIIYTDASGSLITLTPNTDYGTSGIMTPVVGAQDIVRSTVYPITSWPAIKNVPEAVKITCVCGFGSTPDYIPEPIRESILRIVVYMFENPMDEITSETIARFEMGVSSFMSSYEQFGHIADETQRLDYAR